MIYVHICPADKFMPGFIDFIRQHFEFHEHQFWIYGDSQRYDIPEGDNIFHLSGKIKNRLLFIWSLLRCRKIFFHSFHGLKQALLLLLNPWCIRKSFWFIWGGDLYQYQINHKGVKWCLTEFLRRCTIRGMAGIVTYIRGDYLHACQQYRCSVRWYECLMYTSNIFNAHADNAPVTANERPLNILVGNSALPTNNHVVAFDILKKYACHDINVICPLSYGIPDYAHQVERVGRHLFGKRFNAITKFMPASEYLILLRNIDIAVFSHNRQQAMGNTIALLGEGKTVFLNPGTTQWDFFNQHQIHVRDLHSFSLSQLSVSEVENNKQKVGRYFSQENLLRQLSILFQCK
ncbi:TDP-N-acetylfucosamine:lipid II N-acetylfucosaminyltransferase [Enterobacter asburiae]|uniref:TDP-N-acetylfucosamine:lipid II N-acetylfucosaminyltransferase n=1 Tax=Enterobacter asburiae TaxID=61645 RepID=UPI00192CDC57|nr:TDP-N-acetylfucosamine:lipid II N-acetylfucosaminyltransferase [Enterobacter asburiae]MBL5945873.1 TDP-N-acetylfucosamine:lipid II N-acetylfucosaminyltransferase [Enterobacter asburiae]MBL5954395.1 TDP-N-acetylfucosamine:lipid II N-acetylfucosaminyltransferase [Enterobacter asburiae]